MTFGEIAVAALFDVLWLGLGGAALFAAFSRHFSRTEAMILSAYLIVTIFIGASLPHQLIPGSESFVPNFLAWLVVGTGLGYLGYAGAKRLAAPATQSVLFGVAASDALLFGALLPGSNRLNFGMAGGPADISGLLGAILAGGFATSYLITRYRAKATLSKWIVTAFSLVLMIGATIVLVFHGNEGQPIPVATEVPTAQPPPSATCVTSPPAAPAKARDVRLSSNPVGRYSTLSDGNRSLTPSESGKWAVAKATRGVSAGKWYWEVSVSCNSLNVGQFLIGVASSRASLEDYIGSDRFAWSYYSTKQGSGKLHSGALAPYGAQYGKPGDVIGVALDATNRTVSFFLNGVSQGTAFDRSLTGAPLYPAMTDYMESDSSVTVTVNFGEAPFAEPVPKSYRPYFRS